MASSKRSTPRALRSNTSCPCPLNLYRGDQRSTNAHPPGRLASRDASRDQSRHASAPANPTANGQYQALLYSSAESGRGRPHSTTLRVRLCAGFVHQLLDGACPLALSTNRNNPDQGNVWVPPALDDVPTRQSGSPALGRGGIVVESDGNYFPAPSGAASSGHKTQSPLPLIFVLAQKGDAAPDGAQNVRVCVATKVPRLRRSRCPGRRSAPL